MQGFPDLEEENNSNGSSIIHEEKNNTSLPTNDFSQMLYSHNPVFTEPDEQIIQDPEEEQQKEQEQDV